VTDELDVMAYVKKSTGDYTYHGWVVAKFHKLGPEGQPDGPLRYVVQDERGLLMIMSRGQLEPGAGN
jgi:hypothetical protein